MKTLLIIGLIYPEPKTTAAGSRMMQLISLFRVADYQITFACTAKPSERSYKLERNGISTKTIQLNHHSFDVFVADLKPDVVIFDRFIIEEQFGWRVTEKCPDALKILDTEDLHFLRKAREDAVNKGRSVDEADLYSEIAKREMASIYRCDLSLIISEVEMSLLQNTFNISKDLLCYLPFLIEEISEDEIKNVPSFEERKDFMTIGNFLHAPNVDSVRYLKKEIWPIIKKELPEARLHIYGVYDTEHIRQLHDEKNGFLFRGWAENVNEVMKLSRICLAPLRFGAGLKGKIMDAMINGTPCISSKVGAEGIHADFPFPGRIVNTPDEFAQASVEIYSNKDLWLESQQNGFDILEKRFKKELFSISFITNVKNLSEHLSDHRKNNFIGQILQHHTMKSSKYLSKWIEEKNK